MENELTTAELRGDREYASGYLLQAGRKILDAVHECHGGVKETPRRYADGMVTLLRGYWEDPHDHLKIFDAVNTTSMIIMRNVEFVSMCEHHILPFYGVAHVAYIPKADKVIGASKLARIFECFACRLQVQERIGEQFCDFIVEHLSPEGVVCMIEARHMCIGARGVRKPDAVFVTSALRGSFMEPDVRQEFLALVKK